MKLEEYYKIAEERIGQYDAHGFRCKQWLIAILAAILAIMFHQREAAFHMAVFGSLGIVLLFLVDMCFQVVSTRLLEYAEKVEQEMAEHPGENVVDSEKWGLGHHVSLGIGADWRDFWCRLKSGKTLRVRNVLPYAVAAAILWGGFLAASFGGEPRGNGEVMASAWSPAETIMVVLTGVIGLLTLFVFIYAKHTLRAAKESLDFFAKPLVAFKGSEQQEYGGNPAQDGTMMNVHETLVNESPMPIRVDRESDLSVRILLNKSSKSAELLEIRSPVVRSDIPADARPAGWPHYFSRTADLHFSIAVLKIADLPRGSITVTVETVLRYVYRDRVFRASQEFTYRYTRQHPE